MSASITELLRWSVITVFWQTFPALSFVGSSIVNMSISPILTFKAGECDFDVSLKICSHLQLDYASYCMPGLGPLGAQNRLTHFERKVKLQPSKGQASTDSWLCLPVHRR